MSSKSVIKLMLALSFLLNNYCQLVQMRNENEKVKLELTILEQTIDEVTKENKKVSRLSRV